jgi:hypothetical protein
MLAAVHAVGGAARGVRRSLQQQPLSGHGSAAELLTDLEPAAAYAAEMAAAELPPASAAAAVAGQGLYAPYRITKVEQLVYPSMHQALMAPSGAVMGEEELELETQQQYADEEMGVQDRPGGEKREAVQGAQAYDSMHQHTGLQYEDQQHPAEDQRVVLAAAAAEDGPGSAVAPDQTAAAAGRGGGDQDSNLQSNAAAVAASNPATVAAAAAAAASLAATANDDAAAAAAAAGALGPVALDMLGDPSAAGLLAANLGLCDNVQQAAINAAKFLR